MHTISHEKTHIHFNSDFSGEVVIIDGRSKTEVQVPGELIQKVVEHCVRELIENAKEHFLSLPCWPWGKSVHDNS